MAFDPNNPDPNDPNQPANAPIRSSHFGGLGDRRSDHPAVIMKRSSSDGNVKVFEDSTGGASRTEIYTPEGKVIVYKDFEVLPTMSQFKKIEIRTNEDELHGTLDLIPRDRSSTRPIYRAFYERSEIGSANGDIDQVIAHKLLGGAIDTRAGVGSSIDENIITTIQEILHHKR